MSFMLFGRCNYCKYFWDHKVKPHLGLEHPYQDLESWASSNDCNVNRKKNNNTKLLDDDQWVEYEVKYFIENCDLSWTDQKFDKIRKE